MKSTVIETSLSRRIQSVLEDHHRMLRDGARNKLLYEAISRNVTSKTRFLDVGAGSGVWAIIAAKLGAAKVVAVEREEFLIPVIRQHAIENGVGEKVQIVHANAQELQLDGKFDVIVCEIFGHDPFGQETIESVIKIRENFLEKDGLMIPQAMRCFAVPVRIKDDGDEFQLPFTSSFLDTLRLNYIHNYSRAERDRIEILGEGKNLLEIDFRTIVKAGSLVGLKRSWDLTDVSKVNAFAIYNHSVFSDGLELNSYDSNSWVVGIHRFQPFSEKKGKIEFEVTLKNEKVNWKVRLPSHPDSPRQCFSPGFGTARLMMNAKSAGKQNR